ncbi:hypothetical protein GJ496_003339 [Pomphorhynchus laevis]|nr:hypothetical protein GJ496_003339 [Pomphorhynchus laevis]
MSLNTGCVEGWTSVFPSSVSDQISSKKFVKRLFTIALSTVVYVRKVLDESSFDDRNVSGLALKIIRPHCEMSSLLLTWLRGCFDSIEKCYLEQVLVGIFTDTENMNMMQEVYNFTFIHHDKSSQLMFKGFKSKHHEISNFETIQSDTVSLLMTLKKTFESLKPQEVAPYMTMKLIFTKDTPSNYNPPGFVESIYKEFKFNTSAVSLMDRKVNTSFHILSLQVLADSSILNESNHLIENGVKSSSLEDTSKSSEYNFGPSQISNSTKTSLRTKLSYILIEVDPDEAKRKINCPCGVKLDNGPFMLCKLCKRYRHSACFGFIDQEKSVLTDSCHECSPDDTKYSLIDDNEILRSIGLVSMELCCLWRRSILFFVLNTNFFKSKFMNFTESEKHAELMLIIAERNGFISENNSQSGTVKYTVNTKAVMESLRSNHINLISPTGSMVTKTDTVIRNASSKHTQESFNLKRIILSPEVRMFEITERMKDRERIDSRIKVPLQKPKRLKKFPR